MDKELTAPISARIPMSLLTDLHLELRKTEKKILSQWVIEAIEEKMQNDNKALLNIEIKYLTSKLELLKEKSKLIVEKEENISSIPSKEIPFLIETAKIISQDPLFIKGRINLYKNKFRKEYRISEQDFYELLDNAEKQNKNEKKN